jgi:hypothetical protein
MNLNVRLLIFILSASQGSWVHAMQADDPPDVVFNHMYVVVNEETLTILRDHPFFRDEFAAVDSGFSKFQAVNKESQSLYFRGEQTYP